MLTLNLWFDAHFIFRVFLAFWTSLFFCLLTGRKAIEILHGFVQPIRDDGPKSHLKKQGTPTMGGLLIIASSLISILSFANLGNIYVAVCVFVIVVYGTVGFVDDYEKVVKKSSNAMKAKMKLLLQLCAALITIGMITYATVPSGKYVLQFPFFVNLTINLGILYIPFAMVVISGASNGVNLSDGLDGLASGLLFIAFSAFAVVAYFSGIRPESRFLMSLKGTGEVMVVCAAVAGSCLGFLWYNAPRAKVFMGDTGSLALGALIGTVAVILKQEILLGIIGGVFVMETVSVFLQVFWYKKTGRRIFRMAPIHHHFEQLGWPETTVVIRFWIVAIMFAFLGLSSLYIGIRV